jgi:hypothetical protein
MTHRVTSRNAASSRAIPVKKLIQDVVDDPFVPLHWGMNQKGMQGGDELTGDELSTAKNLWFAAANDALYRARDLAATNAHKQIVNRLLEPFAHITVVVSSTEWSNFLALRDHPAAEPHIQILAREVRKELDREDNIQILEPGDWHLPFVSVEDALKLDRMYAANDPLVPNPLQAAIKKSVACCASTSYKTVDGFDMTLEKAIELHDKLVGSAPLHASPAEHVAQADELCDERVFDYEGHWIGDEKSWQKPELHGNFDGFIQYRKMLPNECL